MTTNLLIGLVNGGKPGQPIVSGDVFYDGKNPILSPIAYSMDYDKLDKLFEIERTPSLAIVVASVVSDCETKFGGQYDLSITRRNKK